MGLERTKFLKYTAVFIFILLIFASCAFNVPERMFYVKNGETYLYERGKAYNLGELSEKVKNTGKYAYCLTSDGELCAFYGGKAYSVEKDIKKYVVSDKYVFYIKNGTLYRALGRHSRAVCEKTQDLCTLNRLCIYKSNGKWYFENNEIADVKPIFVTEKYAYYLKNDVLYYKKYKTNSVVVADNIYETAVIKNHLYFFKEKYEEKKFSEIFKYDCLGKDNTEQYNEHINHGDIVNYFSSAGVPFRLYTLYEAELDTKKKLDDDICDISSFYNNGENCAVYKKLSRKKLKLSSLKNISSVYYAVDEKYKKAEIRVLNDGEISTKIKECAADYFEISDNIYYIDSGSFYAGEKKISFADKFKAVRSGAVFMNNGFAYLYSEGTISQIGRNAEKIKSTADDIFFIDNRNLKNTSGTLYKNVDDYMLCGKDLFYISRNELYNNGTKIDTGVSLIY